MTGWGHYIDGLAGAAAALLQADVVRTGPMVDTRGALVSRDAVVAEMRALVASVSGSRGSPAWTRPR